MASFYSNTISNKPIIVAVALVLALSWPDPITASFQDTVTRLCSRTLEFDSCRNCILGDGSIGTEDIPRLTYSVLFCAYSQAVYGHQHADGIGQNVTDPSHKQALKECSAALLGASNRLWDTLTMLEGARYNGAYENVKRSQWALTSCQNAYLKYAEYSTIPSPLLDDMTLAKRLFDVAQYFFRLILKITPENYTEKVL